MLADKGQELSNALVVRISGDNEMKELSGIISGDHFWLNSVNHCRFIAHVPLDDETTRISVRPIQGSLVEYLHDHQKSTNEQISAVFDTISSKGSNQEQRWCALLF